MDPAVRRGEPAALTPLLKDAQVSWDVLHGRYHSLLQLVDTLLGVVPNCDPYLEIWPPAFRSYNVMVPNLLNLPIPVFGLGGPPPGVIGLSMYVASRAAGCAYCSAHSCSFALRRGAPPATLAAALLPDRTSFSRGELAAVAVADSLGRVPCELSAAQKAELVAVFGVRNAEWIALSVVMMGFLNKFMDAVGVELEQAVADETALTLGSGWSPGKAGAGLDAAAPRRPAPSADGLNVKLRVVPLLPAAIRWDYQAQRATPRGWPELREHLARRTGHEFPVLAKVRSARARRAVASMLVENLDPAVSVVGLDVKLSTGTVFAAVSGNPRLQDDLENLARGAGLDADRQKALAAFARDDAPEPPGGPPAETVALRLARAAAHSPARIGAEIVQACEGVLSAAAIIEIVTWLSVLQMLHRLECYVEPPA